MKKAKTKLAQPVYLVITSNQDGDTEIHVFCDQKEAQKKSKELGKEIGGDGEVGVKVKIVSEGVISLSPWLDPKSDCGSVSVLELTGGYEE